MDTILWRRLDTPGHDACRLNRIEGGWRLEGVATFRDEHDPAGLVYQLSCDSAWRSREGRVQGWLGAQRVDIRIERKADGAWLLNSQKAFHLEGCLDLDFGFTPATNLCQLHRVALQVGQAATVPVAWLDVATGHLDVLHQYYERRSAESYWYEAPDLAYSAVLTVDGAGFVTEYTGLWQAEP